MAQAIPTWQVYSMDGNVSSASEDRDADINRFKKRPRPVQDPLDTPAPRKSRKKKPVQAQRVHANGPQTSIAMTAFKAKPPPTEVISLLDDEDAVPQRLVKDQSTYISPHPTTEALDTGASYAASYAYSTPAYKHSNGASYALSYSCPMPADQRAIASYATPHTAPPQQDYYAAGTYHSTAHGLDSHSAYYNVDPEHRQMYTSVSDPATTGYQHFSVAPKQSYDSQCPEAYYYASPPNAPVVTWESPAPPVNVHQPAPSIAAEPRISKDKPEAIDSTSDPTTDVVPILEPVLCSEQADLVDLILSGRNVFYTGSAGCGKSTVLKAFVRRFQERYKKVNIVAPTGRAALDINGSTTWTYAGWTPDHHKRPLKKLKEAAHGKWVSKRLKETDVLVIDEISMVENLHFERLNAVMKEARNSDKAFGGVQIVVTGDFCQLPPVKPFGHCIECGKELLKNKDETEYKCRAHGIYYDKDKWAFRSQAWKECNFAHVNLTQIHRQSDKIFIDMLNKLRMGTPLRQDDIDLLLNHKSETRNAIKLFATRDEVKRVNDQMFNNLPTKARLYKSFDHFHWNEKHFNLANKGDRGPDGSMLALREHRLEPQVQLKKGMLVVLLHNLDLASGLVNGSQGTIQGFEPYAKSRLPKAASNQTVRKPGGAGPEDEPLLGVNVPVLQGDQAVYREARIKDFAEAMEYKGWPIVRFLNGVERTIYADCTVNLLGDEAPHSILSRTQIPLMAAWAMTTHKSQGMTLNRVIVNLAKSFEQGQAYVALSRARSLDGLKVESFPLSAQGKGNPQVKEFLREKFGIS